MDNIWDGNASRSEVIGRCGGMKKTQMTMQNRHKNSLMWSDPKLIP